MSAEEELTKFKGYKEPMYLVPRSRIVVGFFYECAGNAGYQVVYAHMGTRRVELDFLSPDTARKIARWFNVRGI